MNENSLERVPTLFSYIFFVFLAFLFVSFLKFCVLVSMFLFEFLLFLNVPRKLLRSPWWFLHFSKGAGKPLGPASIEFGQSVFLVDCWHMLRNTVDICRYGCFCPFLSCCLHVLQSPFILPWLFGLYSKLFTVGCCLLFVVLRVLALVAFGRYRINSKNHKKTTPSKAKKQKHILKKNIATSH